MEDQKDLPIWMANRFPMVLIDEMQDTSAGQASLLSGVIPRTWKRIVVQRVGDPNQRIFDVDALSGSSEQYPDAGRCLDIPNSYRFGSGIASLASPFAVRPVGRKGLCGIGEEGVGGIGTQYSFFLMIVRVEFLRLSADTRSTFLVRGASAKDWFAPLAIFTIGTPWLVLDIHIIRNPWGTIGAATPMEILRESGIRSLSWSTFGSRRACWGREARSRPVLRRLLRPRLLSHEGWET